MKSLIAKRSYRYFSVQRYEQLKETNKLGWGKMGLTVLGFVLVYKGYTKSVNNTVRKNKEDLVRNLLLRHLDTCERLLENIPSETKEVLENVTNLMRKSRLALTGVPFRSKPFKGLIPLPSYYRYDGKLIENDLNYVGEERTVVQFNYADVVYALSSRSRSDSNKDLTIKHPLNALSQFESITCRPPQYDFLELEFRKIVALFSHYEQICEQFERHQKAILIYDSLNETEMENLKFDSNCFPPEVVRLAKMIAAVDDVRVTKRQRDVAFDAFTVSVQEFIGRTGQNKALKFIERVVGKDKFNHKNFLMDEPSHFSKNHQDAISKLYNARLIPSPDSRSKEIS